MRRSILIATGLLLAFVAGSLCLAAGLVFGALLLPTATSLAIANVAALLVSSLQAGETGAVLAATLKGLWTAAIVVGFVPICLVAVIGEAAQVRSLRWLAGGTGVVAAAMPSVVRAVGEAPVVRPIGVEEARLTLLLFLAGVVSGGVYWLVAGVRSDGTP